MTKTNQPAAFAPAELETVTGGALRARPFHHGMTPFNNPVLDMYMAPTNYWLGVYNNMLRGSMGWWAPS